MPTYEYVCDKCHQSFERWQKITEAPVTVCPDKTCGGAVMRAIGGGAGFLFKGSGFYSTDYRSGDYKKKAQSDTASSGTAGASTGSSDSKPKAGGDSVSKAAGSATDKA
ncbi:MAG: FmdB family zinc ribbon protein [Fibrobacterota bacterium]